MLGASADKGSQRFCACWSEQGIHGFQPLLLSGLLLLLAGWLVSTLVRPERPDQVHKDPCTFALDRDYVGALDEGKQLGQTCRRRVLAIHWFQYEVASIIHCRKELFLMAT